MSSMTGSLRYMAPEVATSGAPYNEVCDVYSFTIVLWEMLSLQRAYMDIAATQDRFVQKVFTDKKRPPNRHSWSRTLHDLLIRGWAHDPRQRLTADQVHDMLRNELVNMRHGDDTDLDHVRRRSTYLLDEESRNMYQTDGSKRTFNRKTASTSDLLVDGSSSSNNQSQTLAWAVKPRSCSM